MKRWDELVFLDAADILLLIWMSRSDRGVCWPGLLEGTLIDCAELVVSFRDFQLRK